MRGGQKWPRRLGRGGWSRKPLGTTGIQGDWYMVFASGGREPPCGNRFLHLVHDPPRDPYPFLRNVFPLPANGMQDWGAWEL